MKLVRLIGIVLLAYLSLGACVGATALIGNAHGNPFGVMPQSLLRHSPFHSYLIPGVILLFANGLLGMWVLWLVVLRRPLFGLWTAFQGCVLLGWLVVECWMVRVVIWAHYLYGAVALALIISGLALHQDAEKTPPAQG